MRGLRAKLKSQRDDLIIAQGKAVEAAALGEPHETQSLSFSNLVWRAEARPTRLEKERNHFLLLTQGGARSSLALGYYQAAPPGLLPSPRYGKASLKGHMNDGRLREVGRRWANHRLQAKPSFTWPGQAPKSRPHFASKRIVLMNWTAN